MRRSLFIILRRFKLFFFSQIQTQEREAANRMRERAKELQRERLEAAKRGQPPRSQTGFG